MTLAKTEKGVKLKKSHEMRLEKGSTCARLTTACSHVLAFLQPPESSDKSRIVNSLECAYVLSAISISQETRLNSELRYAPHCPHECQSFAEVAVLNTIKKYVCNHS